MRILVISNYLDYHSTRPEASIFIGLARAGVEVFIMTHQSSGHVKSFEEAGIKVIDFHPDKKFDRTEVQRIRSFIIENHINILQLYTSKAIINGIRAARGLSVKVVLYRGFAGNIHWYDPAAYLKFLHPRVDKIVCNSKGVEEFIQSQFFFDNKKTITINKGHDLAWYENYSPHDIRQELGLPANSFLLVNVANNRKMKGIPYLLKAISRISKELPIHLLLAGRGMDTPQNFRIIEKAGKRDRVHFLGFRKEVLNLVAACDVFVLSSIMGESITKSVIEAMSLEVAPVITDIPGNRELVIHEESGLVVPSKNSFALSQAILRLYQNRKFLKELGKQARLRIRDHLNAQQTIEQFKALYEELLA